MNVAGNIFLVVYTLFCYFLCACVAVITVIPLIFLLLLLPREMCYKNRIVFFLLDCVYRGVTGSLLVPITISGEDIPTQSAIIIANHQSALDIPIMLVFRFLVFLLNGWAFQLIAKLDQWQQNHCVKV